MDINDLRTILTVLAFLAFLGIMGWAYSARRKQSYDEAAMLPFDDDSQFISQATPNTERKSS